MLKMGKHAQTIKNIDSRITTLFQSIKDEAEKMTPA